MNNGYIEKDKRKKRTMREDGRERERKREKKNYVNHEMLSCLRLQQPQLPYQKSCIRCGTPPSNQKS